MYGIFSQIEVLSSLKMHGYPKFSFWLPRLLVKFCFLRVVLNRAKISLYYSATNSTGATEKTDTLKFKEMFSFLIGLQTTKARLLCCKRDL